MATASKALSVLSELFDILTQRPEFAEGSIQIFPASPEKGDLTPCAVLATADGDFLVEGYGETVNAAIVALGAATDLYYTRATAKLLRDVDQRYSK